MGFRISTIGPKCYSALFIRTLRGRVGGQFFCETNSISIVHSGRWRISAACEPSAFLLDARWPVRFRVLPHGQKAGIMGYLLKPISPLQLQLRTKIAALV
jgi:hypothetical protein